MTTDPQRYRHRSEEVEAVQWTGDNADVLRAFAGPDFDEIDLDDRTEDPDETAAVRESEHGTWRGLKPGDWVVRLDGGLYEFAAADFAKQYEPTPAAPEAAPPTGQTGLRDRIAEAIADALKPRYGGPQHNTPGGLPLTATAEELRLHRAQPLANAVLSVLFGPIPAGTDTATWTAIRAIQLMNEAGRERDASTGASALTDKLLRVRDLHRETCIAAKGDLSPTAFCCGMCQVLDAPAAAVLPAPVDRAAVFAGVRPQTLTAIASHLDARAVAILRPDSETYGEWQAVVAELRQLAAGTPQPETQAAAVLLSSPCDACRHTLNWHRNDIGCVVARCVCSRFQPPADDAPAVTLPGKEA